MKKLLLIVVVVALALTVIAPLAAAEPGGGNRHGHSKFNAGRQGARPSIATAATDTTAASLRHHGQGRQPHRAASSGTDATFDVAADAKIWLLTE